MVNGIRFERETLVILIYIIKIVDEYWFCLLSRKREAFWWVNIGWKIEPKLFHAYLVFWRQNKFKERWTFVIAFFCVLRHKIGFSLFFKSKKFEYFLTSMFLFKCLLKVEQLFGPNLVKRKRILDNSCF